MKISPTKPSSEDAGIPGRTKGHVMSLNTRQQLDPKGGRRLLQRGVERAERAADDQIGQRGQPEDLHHGHADDTVYWVGAGSDTQDIVGDKAAPPEQEDHRKVDHERRGDEGQYR